LVDGTTIPIFLRNANASIELLHWPADHWPDGFFVPA